MAGVSTVSYPGVLAADGSFAIRDLKAGKYSLQLALGYAADPRSEVVRVSLSPDRPEAEATFHFAMSSLSRLQGRVVSAETGEPIESAQVEVSGEHGVRTDRGGAFLLGDLPLGTTSVWVGHADYVGQRFDVDGSRDSHVSFALRRGAGALFSVTDTAGLPRSGVGVQLLGKNYNPTHFTDRAGGAAFLGLPPGETFTFTVQGARAVTIHEPFSLAVGERRPIRVIVE